MSTLVLLHTAPVHVETFGALADELAPDVSVRHLVREDLLADARAMGLEARKVQDGIRAALMEIAQMGADTVLCTCSTIGGSAEDLGADCRLSVLRVDRAMAERAVTLGRHIVVAAVLESTMDPTMALVQEEADKLGADVHLEPRLIEGAWEEFEAGDLAGYIDTIVRDLSRVSEGDVVVLAQASMAAAAARCGELDILVLSSPRLGMGAALRTLPR